MRSFSHKRKAQIKFPNKKLEKIDIANNFLDFIGIRKLIFLIITNSNSFIIQKIISVSQKKNVCGNLFRSIFSGQIDGILILLISLIDFFCFFRGMLGNLIILEIPPSAIFFNKKLGKSSIGLVYLGKP